MTRQRKEIISKYNELLLMEAAEIEMGAGFGGAQISKNFELEYQRLETEFAATYGMSFAEYETMRRELASRMCVPAAI